MYLSIGKWIWKTNQWGPCRFQEHRQHWKSTNKSVKGDYRAVARLPGGPMVKTAQVLQAGVWSQVWELKIPWVPKAGLGRRVAGLLWVKGSDMMGGLGYWKYSVSWSKCCYLCVCSVFEDLVMAGHFRICILFQMYNGICTTQWRLNLSKLGGWAIYGEPAMSTAVRVNVATERLNWTMLQFNTIT